MSKRTGRPRAYLGNSVSSDIWAQDGTFTPGDIGDNLVGDTTQVFGCEQSGNGSTTGSDPKEHSKKDGTSSDDPKDQSAKTSSDSENTSKSRDDASPVASASDSSEKDTSEKDTNEHDSSPDSADDSSENGDARKARAKNKAQRVSPPSTSTSSAAGNEPVLYEVSIEDASLWESSSPGEDSALAKLGRALLIKNINRNTTVPQFCDLLEEHGWETSPRCITVVHIPCNRKKLKARGFVLVHCATKEYAQKLFAQFDGMKIEGHRKFRCQPADKLESAGLLDTLGNYDFPEGYEPRTFCADVSQP